MLPGSNALLRQADVAIHHLRYVQAPVTLVLGVAGGERVAWEEGGGAGWMKKGRTRVGHSRWRSIFCDVLLRCLQPQHNVGPKPWCTVKHMVRDVKRWVCSSCQATTAKEKEIKPNTQGEKNSFRPSFLATQYRRRVPRETLFLTWCGRAYLFQCPFIQLSEVSMPNNPLFRSCRSISTILEMSAHYLHEHDWVATRLATQSTRTTRNLFLSLVGRGTFNIMEFQSLFNQLLEVLCPISLVKCNIGQATMIAGAWSSGMILHSG